IVGVHELGDLGDDLARRTRLPGKRPEALTWPRTRKLTCRRRRECRRDRQRTRSAVMRKRCEQPWHRVHELAGRNGISRRDEQPPLRCRLPEYEQDPGFAEGTVGLVCCRHRCERERVVRPHAADPRTPDSRRTQAEADGWYAIGIGVRLNADGVAFEIGDCDVRDDWRELL